jgi:hypothetical protein
MKKRRIIRVDYPPAGAGKKPPPMAGYGVLSKKYGERECPPRLISGAESSRKKGIR